ncbi:hypothetical protein ACWGGS_21515 [Streptomyces decoyicus]
MPVDTFHTSSAPKDLNGHWSCLIWSAEATGAVPKSSAPTTIAPPTARSVRVKFIPLIPSLRR